MTTHGPAAQPAQICRFRLGLAAIAMVAAPSWCRARLGAARRATGAAMENHPDSDDESTAGTARPETQTNRKKNRRRTAGSTASPDCKPAEGPKGPKGSTIVPLTEVSAYTDSDAVHVLSPTVSGTVMDELAGWSIGG